MLFLLPCQSWDYFVRPFLPDGGHFLLGRGGSVVHPPRRVNAPTEPGRQGTRVWWNLCWWSWTWAAGSQTSPYNHQRGPVYGVRCGSGVYHDGSRSALWRHQKSPWLHGSLLLPARLPLLPELSDPGQLLLLRPPLQHQDVDQRLGPVQDAWHGACDGDWRWLPDDDGQPPPPPTPGSTTDDPASHQHHRRPRLATNTTDVAVPQLTTPASHQHHRRPRLATNTIDAAGQQSPSSRPDVTDSESDSDDELCVLTPQTLAPVAVAVPAVTHVIQRPPA